MSMVLIAICLVAFLYSSVGHGGASGYLAILTLWGLQPDLIRSSALVLNLLVAGIAFISYYQSQKISLARLLPFLAGSVPAAFAGSLIKTDDHLYKILLGILLLIAVLRMVMKIRDFRSDVRPVPVGYAVLTGLVIGFVSGLIGIGGGILLSPVLILFRWATIRETACLSALFIFINSAAGLTGLMLNGTAAGALQVPMVAVALIGGLAGSVTGSRYMPVPAIRLTLALVLVFAGLKLLTG